MGRRVFGRDIRTRILERDGGIWRRTFYWIGLALGGSVDGVSMSAYFGEDRAEDRGREGKDNREPRAKRKHWNRVASPMRSIIIEKRVDLGCR